MGNLWLPLNNVSIKDKTGQMLGLTKKFADKEDKQRVKSLSFNDKA